MVKNFYKNKKILVTGATGFKGAWLCYWLTILGAKVFGVGHNPNKNNNLFYSLKLDKKIKLKLFDIRDKKKLKKLIDSSKPQVIFHLAAQPLILDSYEKPYLTYTVNSIGTLNVLETVRETNSVRSLICITSDKCYESNYSTKGFKEDDKLGGKDPYSGSKASAEIMIKSYQESFFKNKKCGLASGRAGNVIGGGDWSANRLIPDTVNSIIKDKTINIRNPNFNRPWLHVLEPLYGYLLLGEKLFKNPKIYSGPWNFGTKKNTVTNVLKIVKEIVKFWGKGKISFKKNQKYYEQTNLQLNIEKSMKILKWQPKYNITKSVEVTVDWYKKVLIEKLSVEKITEKQIKDYMHECK
ncbi:CDP-glucose 4,6-dehydratase [Candidatus Pelagibacter sp.]|nr:CDP-glucose 4,6-dehydratase [Candidatus Pelagibacter sp.]